MNLRNRKTGLRIGLAAAGVVAVAGLLAGGAAAYRGGDWDSDHEAFVFADVDANGDGGVDATELLAWMESRREARLQQMLQRADSNGDGVLSEAELQELMKRGGHRRKWR